MFSEAARTIRIARCNLLLCSLKNEVSERIRFFSDEKIFTDAKINRRNNQWLDYNSEDIPIVARTKFLANVHVLGIVSSESDIMPPHSIMPSLSLKKEELSQKKFVRSDGCSEDECREWKVWRPEGHMFFSRMVYQLIRVI